MMTYDEVATLKEDIEVVQAKLKNSMLKSRREAKAKKCTNFGWLLVG